MPRAGHIFSAQGCTATDANADVDDLKSERRQFKRQPLSRANTHTRTQGHTLTQGHEAALRAKQTELLLQLQLQARQRRRCCGHIRNLLQSELCSRISLDSERERVLEAVSLVKLENCRATKPDQQHSSNIFLWVNSFAQCNSKSFAHTDIHVEPSEPDEEQPEGQF